MQGMIGGKFGNPKIYALLGKLALFVGIFCTVGEMAGRWYFERPQELGIGAYLEKDGKRIASLEVADEDAERHKGLMFRKRLEQGRGMLFVLDNRREASMWMRNTKLSLDMVFLDGAVVHRVVHGAKPCKALDCDIFESEGPVTQVIELNAGEAHAFGLKKGDRLEIKKQNSP